MKPEISLRSIEDADWEDITRIFWDTFVLGSPLPLRLHNAPAYEDLSLGWFRRNPGDSRVAVSGECGVVGYVLVCAAQSGFEVDQRSAGARYLRTVMPQLIGTGLSRFERRFIWLRAVDGFEAWRDEDPMAVGMHAHFNLARGFRSGLIVRTFVEHIDEMCREAGLTHWTGQINAIRGRRLGLLRSYGFKIASTTSNRTLSWLARADVERATVVREAGLIERVRAA